MQQLQSLEYLSSLWRSLEVPLINCKAELKLRLAKHCVLSVAGTDNANGNNNNNNIFTVKDTKFHFPVVTVSVRDNFLVKDLKDQFIGKKQKVTIKIQQTNLDFSLNQILLESKFVFMQIKMLLLKNLKLRGITNQKDLLIIIMLPSMEKAFMINQLVLI